MSGTTPRRSGPGGGALTKKAPFFVRAPPPGPLRRGVVPLTGYRGMSHALFFRLRASSNPRPKGHIEMGPPGPLRRGVVPLTGYRGMSHALFFRLRASSNPRPKGHIEMGSTLTTNWASSSVGSESAPHFNMSLWSWVRARTETKEKGMGHAPIACEWDHPSSEWARGWGPYTLAPSPSLLIKRSSPIASDSVASIHTIKSLLSNTLQLDQDRQSTLAAKQEIRQWSMSA